MKRIIILVLGLCLGFFSGFGKEKDKSESGEVKESKFGATPYIYTGPDTGFGVGAAGIARDFLGKEARDFTFSVSYTEKQYQYYSITWQEPRLFTDKGFGVVSLGYENKPSRRFYGIGNDSDKDNVCSFGSSYIYIEPRYDYWFLTGKRRLGIKVNYRFASFTPEDGFFDEYDALYQRPISMVFPSFDHSDDFKSGVVSGLGALLVYDDRKDKFPLGGGRDEVVYPYKGGRQSLYLAWYNKSLGSDYDYTNFIMNLTYFIPLGSDQNVLGLRGAIDIKDGEVPFWELSSFGSESTLRGYNDGRFRDNHAAVFNAELWHAFDYSFHLPGPLKSFVVKAPMLVAFYDYGRVFNEIEEITEDFGGYHWSYGAGFRFIISPSVLIRFDYAFSDEMSAYYLTAGWPF